MKQGKSAAVFDVDISVVPGHSDALEEVCQHVYRLLSVQKLNFLRYRRS